MYNKKEQVKDGVLVEQLETWNAMKDAPGTERETLLTL